MAACRSGSCPSRSGTTSIAWDCAHITSPADIARELRPHGVAVVALWPGLTRTELVMANPQLSPFAERVGHSAQLTGRAVAALTGDPAIIDKTGQSIDV